MASAPISTRAGASGSKIDIAHLISALQAMRLPPLGEKGDDSKEKLSPGELHVEDSDEAPVPDESESYQDQDSKEAPLPAEFQIN